MSGSSLTVPTVVASSVPSASPSDKKTIPAKKRSCVVCRNRKVRCDKGSPCSNCRKANISCVLPSLDRPPRWARRLERVANDAAVASRSQVSQDTDPAAAQVMERLRTLESLVIELNQQLQQANAAARSSNGGSSDAGVNSPESSTIDRTMDHESHETPDSNISKTEKRLERLALQDGSKSRYVSSGFWSRVNDELDGLKVASRSLGGDDDSDTSEDEFLPVRASPIDEFRRTPAERSGFVFQHNLGSSTLDTRQLHPLPSQITFLLDIYAENIHSIGSVIHLPTVTKMTREYRSNMWKLTPPDEAIVFAIYYAAITSMEEEDVMTNFGFSKAELNLKYRLGLEHSLTKADFLSSPDFALVQALTIFLCVVRRDDSPRFVWMMTGIAVRMAQALNLHRDGSKSSHLTPYEIEMRRRVWWALILLDMRASEDLGTDYTVALGSFDTKLPLNINDSDITPQSTTMPVERAGLTDITFALVFLELGELAMQIMAKSAKEGAPAIEEQTQLMGKMYERLDQRYLQYSVQSGNIIYWIGVLSTRLVMAKMTLLVSLPVLFSSQSHHFSEETKTKLLVSAIEVAEYNHALNAEQAARRYHWLHQTYTHWYAVVYLLTEICRRPWSALVERAWIALHSPWLVAAQSHMDKKLPVWVPLRKLTIKARKHREAELGRLRNDPVAAQQLEEEDRNFPVPTSTGPFPAGSNTIQLFRDRWYQLLAMPMGFDYGITQPHSGPGLTIPSAISPHIIQQDRTPISTSSNDNSKSNGTSEFSYKFGKEAPTNPNPSTNAPSHFPPSEFTPDQNDWPWFNVEPPDMPRSWTVLPKGLDPWLWADTDNLSDDIFGDINPVHASPPTTAGATATGMDLDLEMETEINWMNWIQSAKGTERGPWLSGIGP